MSLTEKINESNTEKKRGLKESWEEFKDWVYEYTCFERFVEGYKRQVDKDKELAEKLKSAGIKKPIKIENFKKLIKNKKIPENMSWDNAYELQRFDVSTPTNTYRAFGLHPYFVYHDLGVKIAYAIPFKRYMKESKIESIANI